MMSHVFYSRLGHHDVPQLPHPAPHLPVRHRRQLPRVNHPYACAAVYTYNPVNGGSFFFPPPPLSGLNSKVESLLSLAGPPPAAPPD
jgi:hypothetical protein